MPAIFAVSRGQVSTQLAKINVIAKHFAAQFLQSEALAVLISQRELRAPARSLRAAGRP